MFRFYYPNEKSLWRYPIPFSSHDIPKTFCLTSSHDPDDAKVIMLLSVRPDPSTKSHFSHRPPTTREIGKRGRPRTRPTIETQVPEPFRQQSYANQIATNKLQRQIDFFWPIFQYTQGQTPQAAAIPATDQALERFLRFQPPKFLGEPDDYKA
ncbi:UNVERIFIED_CONTAM: hypothetical protein Slati_3886900 [Sesamum latifolium]|uniref:Uncharacterized protein n=1 Tax=Sesamum latifolium TaxID=2727402 RepID=A0AAW2TL87_9LAMI